MYGPSMMVVNQKDPYFPAGIWCPVIYENKDTLCLWNMKEPFFLGRSTAEYAYLKNGTITVLQNPYGKGLKTSYNFISVPVDLHVVMNITKDPLLPLKATGTFLVDSPDKRPGDFCEFAVDFTKDYLKITLSRKGTHSECDFKGYIAGNIYIY
jgi:hypothetical protein